MTNPYKDDRRWSDRFIPTVKKLVAPFFCVETPFEVDAKEAADLFFLDIRPKKIACRVRRAGFQDRYPYEFTVRSARDSGATTELEKIIDGEADFMFYGHAVNSHDSTIGNWFLIDLNQFRAALIRHARTGGVNLSKSKKSNGDGTHFVAYDLRSFPEKIIADSNVDVPFFKSSPGRERNMLFIEEAA